MATTVNPTRMELTRLKKRVKNPCLKSLGYRQEDWQLPLSFSFPRLDNSIVAGSIGSVQYFLLPGFHTGKA